MRTILHIDFNSYFATVEQQANPRLRGKPVGVTGGDRMKRTVIGAASVEAKRFGVRGGMALWEAQKLCPEIILVKGDSDKYLETTKRFLNILKDYDPNLEVFSIDEVFLEVTPVILNKVKDLSTCLSPTSVGDSSLKTPQNDNFIYVMKIAREIKSRIYTEIGEVVTCSIGISYNKLMAKLAGSLYKPDGLVVIADEQAAQFILDRVDLDEICGIGRQIKKRLLNMGITNFQNLRKASKESLVASFKSYGETLYNMSRGIDKNPVIPFFEKEEVKSIGHRHTLNHDTNDPLEIKQLLLKLTELIARRLRNKKLVGRTVSCFYREAFNFSFGAAQHTFIGGGMQVTIPYTNDGLDIFKAAESIFSQVWHPSAGHSTLKDELSGSDSKSSGQVRMIGVSISNLKPKLPETLSLLEETHKQETMIRVIDKINDKFGEFTLQRGVLLNSSKVTRKANPFLADRRFKI